MESLEKRSYVGLAQFSIALFVLIFLPAWNIFFIRGWIYLLIFIVCILFITIYFLKHDRKLIERRLSVGPKAEKEKTQKIIQTITSILFITLLVLPGIDQHLSLPHPAFIISLISNGFIILSFFIIFLVFKENSFTASTVQVDKKQKVITTGPYSVVRHPMYSGALFLFFFTPLALGSYITLCISVLLTGMLIIRLLDEEKLLHKELDGYTQYTHKTKYHLIPFIW